MQHWKEDFMFGYQYLNGCNPVVIRKCTEIPDKFPVTHKIVENSLERGLTLEEELKVRNTHEPFTGCVGSTWNNQRDSVWF